MDTGLPVARYQLLAVFVDGVIEWRLCMETDDGTRHVLPVRDGEEVPILLDLFRHDKAVYFDPNQRALRTGWNFPGDGQRPG